MRKLWIIILVLIIIVLLLSLLDSCRQNAKYISQVTELVNYKDTVVYYKAKNGKLIASNKSVTVSYVALMSTNQDLEKRIKNLKLKKPTSVTIIRSEGRIDSILVPFKDSLPCDEFKLPIKIDSIYYGIYGSITNKHLRFDSIIIPNTQEIIVATKKNGLFKRNENIITITNSNPHVKTKGIQNYIIKQNTKRLTFGPSLTYGLSIPDLKPQFVAGISFQYKLFGF